MHLHTNINHEALEQLGPIIIPRLALAIEDVTGIDPDKVTYQVSFVNDLGIDSLSMIEIVVHIEDMYDVEIPDEDLARLRTVDDVIEYSYSVMMDFPRAAHELAAQFGSPDEQAVIKRLASIT